MVKVFARFRILLLVSALFLASCAPAQTTETPAASTGSTSAPAANPSSAAPAQTGQPATAGPVTGTPASSNGEIQFSLVPGKSTASYKVREQLARLSLPSDAIGKTTSVSGSVFLKPDGSIDSTNSKFTVDLSTLQTDEAMRDNFVRRNILQTSQYPQAVFVPTGVSGLPSPMPQSGNVSFKLEGNLTIRDVTKPVTWDVTGSIQNGEATGTATTSFKFEDFNLNQPQVPVVLSVVDNITLQVDVDMKQVTP